MDNLTKEQKDLCYSIILALVKSIVNMDPEKIWKVIEKEMESHGK